MSQCTIGEKIAELRKAKGLSQKDLADKLSVSNKTISKWECGNGEPDINLLKKISAIFCVSIDYLLDNEAESGITENENIEQLNSDSVQPTVVVNKQNKKKISIISSLITAVIVIFFVCFFFIPRTPQIYESDYFTINDETSSLYCEVDNDTNTYTIGDFKVPMFNSWYVYRDTSLGVLISDTTVNLQIGNNNFYVVVKNNVGQTKMYTLTIRRKPLYVVTFDADGGDEILPKSIMEGEFLENITPNRDGYIFAGWDYDFNQAILADTTIKANWIAKEFNITYYSNNETSETQKQDITYGTRTTLFDAATFSLIGYTLSGWNTKPDGTGDMYETSQLFTEYNFSFDLNLYAYWTINSYNLTAEQNIINAGTISGTGKFDYNSKQQLLATTNAGNSWLGWYDNNDNFITSNTQIEVTIQNGDSLFIAKWQKNSYLITLNVNGGDELSNTEQTITYDSSFSLPVPTRMEATFVGWYFDNVQYTDGTGSSVIDWNIANDTTLKANWNINKYNVALSMNNEKGGYSIWQRR